MIERDNFVAALDAYLKKQIEAHFEGRTPAVTPAAGTTPPVANRVKPDYSGVKYDDAARQEALAIIRLNGLDTEGMADQTIAFTLASINAMALEHPGVYKTKKDLGDTSRVEMKRDEAIRVLTRFNVDTTGMNDSQLADAMHTLSPEINKYTIVD